MQLLINVSDYDLEYIRNMYDIPKDISVSIAEALLNGRKIPPHGRLGDLDKLMTEFVDSDLDHLQRDDWREVIQIVSDAETVIEAEGEAE